jgi:hypothetical protein
MRVVVGRAAFTWLMRHDRDITSVKLSNACIMDPGFAAHVALLLP